MKRGWAALMVLAVVAVPAGCGRERTLGPLSGPTAPSGETSPAASEPSTSASASGAPLADGPGGTAPATHGGDTGQEPGPAQGSNRCGVIPPPAGPAGRKPQTIVFPDPGTHRWPDFEVALAACATSGLPVSYRVERSDKPCILKKVGGATVARADDVPTEGCVIVASQAGNAEFSPAQPVSRTYRVLYQIVDVEWLGPSTSEPLIFHPTGGGSNTITVRMKYTSSGKMSLAAKLNAHGSCSTSPAEFVEGVTSKVVEVELTILDPGPNGARCRLHPIAGSAWVGGGSRPTWDFAVRRG